MATSSESAATPEASPFFISVDGLRDPQKAQVALSTASFRQAALQGLLVALGGAILFGMWTGLYAMTLPQLLASALKAPILLLGTTLICFPCFFVMQAVLAPRPLALRSAVLLQTTTLAIIGTTWAVVALPCSLFIASAENYVATKLLVTVVAAFGGGVGLSWFLRYFRSASAGDGGGSVRYLVPYCLLYMLVGAQLAWSLRPFIGSPSDGFVLFRPLGGSLIENLLFAR